MWKLDLRLIEIQINIILKNMNLEKVKNYNQKMLSIFINIIVGIAAVVIVSIIVFLISEIISNN